jgi:hypothetical protein
MSEKFKTKGIKPSSTLLTKGCKSRVSRLISTIMIIATIFTIAPVVYAATDGFIEPFLTARKTVIEGKGTYSPNLSKYPFNAENITAIGFDSLYGGSRKLVSYKGEIPYYLRDQFPYRYYNGEEINGRERPFSSGLNGQWGADKIDDSSTDPHLWAMTQPTDSVGEFFGGLALGIINALHWISKLLVDISVTIKSIDLSAILSVFDQGSGELAKILSSIFLIDLATGTLSPFLVFALFMFLVSFVGLAFKVIKGDTTLKVVAQEFSIFLVALLITGMFFTPSNPAKVSNVGIDFISALSNDLAVMSMGDAGAVYDYQTDASLGTDTAATQKGLVGKVYIDSIIEAQFGMPINDLYIVGPDGNAGSLCTVEQAERALEVTFPNGNINSMRVQTDTNGQNSINNLGYYWWAANSSVYINDTVSSGLAFTSSGQTVVNLDSNDRILYVVDFLSNLKEQNSGDAQLVGKVDKIMYSLVNPSYGTACANVFMSFLQNLLLAFGLFQISIFCMLGQTIIIIGSFAMVVMPAMLLFRGTRDIARRMVWTYLLAFFRFLIGSALFNVLIVVVVLLSAQGIGGMLVGMVLSVVMAKFGPIIIQEINMYISRTVGGRELGFVNRAFARRGRYGSRGGRGTFGLGSAFRRLRNKPSTGQTPGTRSGAGSGAPGNSGNGGATGAGNGNSGTNPSGNQQDNGADEPVVDNEDFVDGTEIPVEETGRRDANGESDEEVGPDNEENDGEQKPVTSGNAHGVIPEEPLVDNEGSELGAGAEPKGKERAQPDESEESLDGAATVSLSMRDRDLDEIQKPDNESMGEKHEEDDFEIVSDGTETPMSVPEGQSHVVHLDQKVEGQSKQHTAKLHQEVLEQQSSGLTVEKVQVGENVVEQRNKQGQVKKVKLGGSSSQNIKMQQEKSEGKKPVQDQRVPGSQTEEIHQNGERAQVQERFLQEQPVAKKKVQQKDQGKKKGVFGKKKDDDVKTSAEFEMEDKRNLEPAQERMVAERQSKVEDASGKREGISLEVDGKISEQRKRNGAEAAVGLLDQDSEDL